jgi:alpha/beta hydrolase fold
MAKSFAPLSVLIVVPSPLGPRLLILVSATDHNKRSAGSNQIATTVISTFLGSGCWLPHIRSVDDSIFLRWFLSALLCSAPSDGEVASDGYDPLADEGMAYARKLEDNGVPVTLVHMSDQMHGFLTMGRVIRAADLALEMASAALARAFLLTSATAEARELKGVAFG